MKYITRFAIGLTVLLPIGVSLADVNAGKIYKDRCTACHGDSVYTRPDRKVSSLEALSAQVNACGHGSGKPLNAEERNAMIHYLNKKYYRFK